MSKRQSSEEAYKELMESIDLSETAPSDSKGVPPGGTGGVLGVHPGGTGRYNPVESSDKVRRTFILTKDLLSDLLNYCERTNQLPSHVVRQAIEEFLSRQE